VEGNGHPPTTQFVVKFANEIGFGGPFNADKAREEIELNGKRDENDTAYSNVEWIREWDGVKQGRERSVADFIEDGQKTPAFQFARETPLVEVGTGVGTTRAFPPGLARLTRTVEPKPLNQNP
jgi:hypothetical protein